MRTRGTAVWLVAVALLAGPGAAAGARNDSRKKKLSRPVARASSKKASTPRLSLNADAFRAAGDDAKRSLSGLGDSTAGDRRKLGSLFEGLGDSLRDAWNRFFGPAKKKS